MSNIYIHTYIYIVDVDGLFYVCKMVEIHHKKKINEHSRILLMIGYTTLKWISTLSIPPS